jgi:hypothetical protein
MGTSSEREPAGTVINWMEAIPESERHIASNTAAKAALDGLEASGCDRGRILRALYMYCGGTPEKVSAVKKKLRWQRGFILKLAKQLEKRVVPDIKRAERILDDAGIAVSSSEPEALESYAELLKRLADAALKRPSSARVTGRDQHLRFLAEMVAITTGREHYAELAELAAAVRMGYTGEPGNATADNIGRLVRRLRRRGPLDLGSAQELEELRKAGR